MLTVYKFIELYTLYVHLGIPRSLNYYIALAPTCWIHLLDENGEVEPALSCLKIRQS